MVRACLALLEDLGLSQFPAPVAGGLQWPVALAPGQRVCEHYTLMFTYLLIIENI